MVRVKIETEALILSITKNCESLFKQTDRKAEKTLEFKLTKPREIFLFNPTISNEEDRMIGLTSLEVYNSVFNLRKEINKFERLVFPDAKVGGISLEKIRD